jgi:uncharacterized protein YukE
MSVELFTPRGLQIRDTADCKSALRGQCMDAPSGPAAPVLLWHLAGRWIMLSPANTTKGQTMAQAIMDPEKVRRFADELQRFNSDLENRLVMLQARFGALGDTWQDQEHEKFSEEFKVAMKALKKFVELSKAHTPYLLRKAQRIEEYLHQR